MRLLSLLLCSLALTGCYEDRVGCLDPDAANYDLLADEACGDCCVAPTLSVRLRTVWDSTAFDLAQTYTDGAGNGFRVVRFRYYLGDLNLRSFDEPLDEPLNPVAVNLVSGGDTTAATLNANLLLRSAGTGATTSGVGTVRLGGRALTALTGTFGLPERFRTVFPPSAPRESPLRTQPGRLNFNDGRGYVRSRLEYTLDGNSDTLSVSTFGSAPVTVDFGGVLQPLRGTNLTLELAADLRSVLGTVDLARDSAAVAAAIDARLAALLTFTGAVQ